MGLKVVNRKGEEEAVRFDAIREKLEGLAEGLDQNWVDTGLVAKLVIEGLYDGVTTKELDQLSAETAASLVSNHPDYSYLAARIAVDDLHKSTSDSFSEIINQLHTYIDPESDKPAPLISAEVHKIIMDNAEMLDSHIDYNRDNNYDYFGFKTIERSYLLKMYGIVAERPQQMLMRVSIGIHKNNLEKALETYDLMSEGWFTHATPTLFNSGTPNPQMSSCFLLTMQDDSQVSRWHRNISSPHPFQRLLHQRHKWHQQWISANAKSIQRHSSLCRPRWGKAQGFHSSLLRTMAP
jgi:ribonucleoside-diphosphate reductase alpha chain